MLLEVKVDNVSFRYIVVNAIIGIMLWRLGKLRDIEYFLCSIFYF